MSAVFYILLGWLLTIFSCWGWGWVPLRVLRLEGEERVIAVYRFILGAAMLSLLMFLFCAAQLVYKGSIYAVLIAGIGLLVWKRPGRITLPWDWTGWIYAGFGVYYFLYALMPEMSPDGMSYHLSLVNRYYREHGFTPLATNMYASLSQGFEMLFLPAFAIGRHSAAALVHYTFLMLIPPAMAIHAGLIGWRAGLFVILLPLFAIDGVSAYNDVALALVAFVVMDAMTRGWVSAAALLVGFAFSIKYTGGIFALLLLPAWRQWPRWGFAAVLSLPWLIKNGNFFGNPVAPFFNTWFPNPLQNPEFESGYQSLLRTYNLEGRMDWAREVIRGGPKLGGFLGPAAALLPLGLFARGAMNRPWWMGGLACALSIYPANVGARFLLPAVPFLALGLMHVLGKRGHWAVIVALVCSWPTVRATYTLPGAWQLDGIAWRAAWRLEREDEFLSRMRGGYVSARTIEAFVPAGESTYAATPVAESYTNRNTIVGYQSTTGQRLQQALAAFNYEGYQHRFVYSCAGNRLEVAEDGNEAWSISEIEPRPESIRCNRFPWDARFAMDTFATSRWRTWGRAKAGDYCEVTGRGPWKIRATTDQWTVKLKGCERSTDESPVDYRADARRFFLAEGVRYLAIDEPDYTSADMKANPEAWGIELLAERGTMRIYRWKDK